MMASAASWLPSRDSLETSCGTPVSNGAVGSCTPMTPVDATKTSSAGMQSAWAAIDCMACAAARPGSPVAALAMPEFKMTARALPPAATARETCTGAAQNTFFVNVPVATVLFDDETTSAASKRSGSFRNPICAPAAEKPSGAVTPPSMNSCPVVLSAMPTSQIAAHAVVRFIVKCR